MRSETNKSKLDLGLFSHGPGEGNAEHDTPTHLTWRRDPDKSLSDWTIVVTTGTSKEPATYHVHKAVVGAGPRASQYFFRLFKTQGLAESITSMSMFTLESSAARAFPDMLDFMYGHHSGSLSATSDTAVALRHLANYFGVPALFSVQFSK